jgi:hypothetical protein
VESDSKIEHQIVGLEKSLLDSMVRKSARVADLLADSFIEFGSSGRTFDKQQMIAALRSEPESRLSASNFAFKLIAPNTALLTYRAQSHTEPIVHTLRSSIWQQHYNRWQLIFHQGTLSSATHISGD